MPVSYLDVYVFLNHSSPGVGKDEVIFRDSDIDNQDSRVLSQLAQLRYKLFRDTAKFASAMYGYMCLKLEDGWTKIS